MILTQSGSLGPVFARPLMRKLSTLPRMSTPEAIDYAGIFSQSSGISKGWIHEERESASVTIQRTVRDLEGNSMRSFVQSYEFASGNWRSSPFPVETTGSQVFAPSPSGRKLAVVREASQQGGEKKGASKDYVIEIWDNSDGESGLIERIPTSGIHENIVSGWFGNFHWSQDETKALYVAQQKTADTRSFFAKEPTSSVPAPPTAGSQFLYREDWGEQYDGVVSLGLYMVDLGGSGRVVEITGVPEGLTPGQPCFSKDGRHVVYTAWDATPRKLGMIYCYQRPCRLYSCPIGELLEDTLQGTLPESPSLPLQSTTTSSLPEEEPLGGAREMRQENGDGLPPLPRTPDHTCLSPSWKLSRCPRFSPLGDQLVWLSREEGFDTHSGCFRLSIASWDPEKGTLASEPRTLVDIVSVPEAPGAFPGLWADDLPEACWSGDGKSLFLSSSWGAVESVVRVDVETGKVTRVEAAAAAATASRGQKKTGGRGREAAVRGDSSAKVLAAAGDSILVSGSSPSSPGGFAVVSGFTGGKETANCGPPLGTAAVTSSVRVGQGQARKLREQVGGIRWRVLKVPCPPAGDGRGASEGDQPFEAILLLPPEQKEEGEAANGVEGQILRAGDGKMKMTTEKVSERETNHPLEKRAGSSPPYPLVVVPHGGPHGAFSTAFIPGYAFLCASQGLALLLVNYRGSTGYGTTPLDSLPGKVGTQDVADVVAAVEVALESEPVALQRSRIGVVGGSHGGFLGAHLSAQHPGLFKVAALRNPVTNIASMVTMSDIPDWCYIEALGHGSYDFDGFRPPSGEELRKMWEVSPVAHAGGVVAPTLIALGAKDRRVPCAQGIEWYHSLKSRGVETKLLYYPEDVHGLDKPGTEADGWLSVALWLKEHI
ncbi:unnamed protein product [Discosporangium mesarthrocarpum]